MASPVWRPNDPAEPLSQGDLVVVTWAKTIEPQGSRLSSRRLPIAGSRDAFDMVYWSPGSSDVPEAWAFVNHALAVVVSHDCAIDNEFFQRYDYFIKTMDDASANERASAETNGFVTIAEAWPIDAFPDYCQHDAERGALSYLPFHLGSLIPQDQRPYSIDLSRLATVRARSIQLRAGIGDASWKLAIQTAICKHFAARTIHLSEDLQASVAAGIERIEVLTPPKGTPAKARIRLRLAGDKILDLEGIVADPSTNNEPPRPPKGFRGRAG